MKIIPLGELYQIDFTVYKLFSMFQYWKDGDSFSYTDSPRPSHALLYLSNCNADYTIEGKPSVHAKKGDIVYIPKGAKYISRFLDARKDLEGTILIEFLITDSENDPIALNNSICIISLHNPLYFHNAFSEMAKAYYSSLQSPALLKSILYRILADLSSIQRRADIYSKEYQNIIKGIIYLEEDLNQDLSVAEIAKMCNVSSNCFRRLFKAYSGMSPSDYRLSVKISKAKQFLESNTVSITEISDTLGFTDPAYFSRLFKQKTGISPKEYSAQFLNSTLTHGHHGN